MGQARAAAYLVVPAVTLAVAVALLLAFATPRTLIAVRLWGGPTEGGHQAVRLQCVRRAVGVEDGVPLGDLVLRVGSTDLPCSCDERGYGEVQLGQQGPGPLALQVRQHQRTLAEGVAQVPAGEWLAGATRIPARLQASGSLPLRAELVGGALLLERQGLLRLQVPEELRAPGKLRFEGHGVEVLEQERSPLGLQVRLRPTFFTAQLTVKDAEGAGWEAALPVRMSGVAAEQLQLTAGELQAHLRSSTASPFAYVQVQDQRGRRAAQAVRLTPDGRGGAHGPLRLALAGLEPPAWLLTSTSPQPSLEGAIAWPLHPGEAPDGRVIPDRLWVDGMGPTLQQESGRLRRRLGAVGVVVLLGAVAEALLLFDRVRASRDAFRRHLERAGEEGDEQQLTEAHGGLRFAVAAALVLFGFAVIGALLVARLEG
ncbi:MAG: hypothetical protein MUF64_19950 [Polyangiaceae bacterium]|nr:hypothetical protein [Polyangiaceae bacterium]